TMLFASLFFAYAVLRMSSGVWPPEGATALPRALPFANTLVLLASSGLLAWGVSPARERVGRLRITLLATIALGALFLSLQMVVWAPLWRHGFRFDSGIYG